MSSYVHQISKGNYITDPLTAGSAFTGSNQALPGNHRLYFSAEGQKTSSDD
jgi:hypothetical protein